MCFSLLFSGCANSIKYQIGSVDPHNSKTIQVIDDRTNDQKKGEAMSANKNNCWFGIYRIGDNQVEPSKLDVLASIIQLKIGEKINGKKVVVKRFEIFNNIQLGMKKAVSIASFGMAKMVPSNDEIRSGKCEDVFALDINSTNSPSVIVLYDVILDGKLISGKVIQLDPENINDNNARSPTVRARIQKGISSAAEEISNKYSE
jgi:hypothetical protein